MKVLRSGTLASIALTFSPIAISASAPIAPPSPPPRAPVMKPLYGTTIVAASAGRLRGASPHLQSRPADGQSAEIAAPADFASLVRAIKGRWSVVKVGDNSGSGVSKPSRPGEQVWRLGLGGSVLMEEERVPSERGAQYVLALQWWDSETRSLKGLLCNNSGSGACNVDSYYRSKLTWDGKQLTINLVFSQGQKMMLWHEVYKDFTLNSFNQTGAIGEVGGPLQRVLNMHATRVGAG